MLYLQTTGTEALIKVIREQCRAGHLTATQEALATHDLEQVNERLQDVIDTLNNDDLPGM